MKFYNNTIVSITNHNMTLLINESDAPRLNFLLKDDDFKIYKFPNKGFHNKGICIPFESSDFTPSPSWWMTKAHDGNCFPLLVSESHANYLSIL